MSSHHFVRDKQEPALLVLSFNDFPEEMLGQLLEWCPAVFVLVSEADELLSRDIKVDYIITNPSSTNGIDIQENTNLLQLENLEANAIIDYLVQEKYPAVNILGNKNILDQLKPFTNQIDIVLYDGNQRFYPVHGFFQKWYPKNEKLELFGHENKTTTLDGLEMIGNDQYQTINEGLITIDAHDTTIFVAENLF